MFHKLVNKRNKEKMHLVDELVKLSPREGDSLEEVIAKEKGLKKLDSEDFLVVRALDKCRDRRKELNSEYKLNEILHKNTKPSNPNEVLARLRKADEEEV